MRRCLLSVLLLIFLCCLSGCAEEKGYEEVKVEAVWFLEANQKELEAIAQQTIEDSSVPDYTLEGISYINYDDENQYVIFDLDAQGMLGGQYWSLVYTPDGIYEGEFRMYSYYEENGNNLRIAEKVQDLWFFLWDDYDGREDLRDTQ